MKDLEKQFWKILEWSPNEPLYGEENKRKIEALIQAVSNYFKQSGKQGGNTTKQRHPDHLKEISKKGVEARKVKRRLKEV